MLSLCATALCGYVYKCPFLHLPSVYFSHPAFQHIPSFEVTEEFQTNLTDQSLKKSKYLPVMQNQATVKMLAVILAQPILEPRITGFLGLEVTSQDHSMPMLKEGQLRHVAQDHVQSAFKYLQGWRHHSLSRQFLSLFAYPHSKKSVFSCFIWNFMCSDLCLLFCHWALRV